MAGEHQGSELKWNLPVAPPARPGPARPPAVKAAAETIAGPAKGQAAAAASQHSPPRAPSSPTKAQAERPAEARQNSPKPPSSPVKSEPALNDESRGVRPEAATVQWTRKYADGPAADRTAHLKAWGEYRWHSLATLACRPAAAVPDHRPVQWPQPYVWRRDRQLSQCSASKEPQGTPTAHCAPAGGNAPCKVHSTNATTGRRQPMQSSRVERRRLSRSQIGRSCNRPGRGKQ